MPSPLGTGRASTRAGSSRSSTASTVAARSPQAPPQAAAQAPGPATGHGAAQHGQDHHEHEAQEQQTRPEQQQYQQQYQQHQQQQQQQQQQEHGSYRHHGSARAGYRPAQVRRLPFDMSTYAHFMLTHTKHQMDAVPDAEPPPAHLSIAGLPRDRDAHAGGHKDHRERHPNSGRTSTADAANGMSS